MSAPSIRVVIPLADARKNPRTGSKATLLAELIAAGFAVPRGFAISADAYRSHLWASGNRTIASGQAEAEEREAIRSAILSRAIPEDVWTAVTTAYERLSWQTGVPEPRVAVRSSALENSGAGFPGAYESYLNVSGLDALNMAIKRVWASLWSGKAAAYRARSGSVGEPAMAVIVQQMVEADCTGSAFTANPVTGDPNSVAVTVRGETISQYAVHLADLNVTRVPDKREEHDGVADVPDHTLLVNAVAEQAILVEDVFGGRVEIDWASDRDGVWILQAGLITGLPPYFPTDGTDAVLALQDERPLSHFARSLTQPSSARILNGRLYRVEESEADPQRVVRLLKEWHGCVRPGLLERSSGVVSAGPAKLDDRALAEALKQQARDVGAAREWMVRSERTAEACIETLRQVVGQGSVLRRLLGGIEDAVLERDALLQELAERFSIAERTGKLEDETWWRRYKADVEQFARYYGYAFRDSGDAADISRWKSWIEDLDSVFWMVSAMAKRGDRPTLVTLHGAAKQDAEAAEAGLMTTLPRGKQANMMRVLELARSWIRARSEIEQACALSASALRLLLTERAKRMISGGLIAAEDDVFQLSLPEVLNASGRAEVAELVAKRKHEMWLQSRLVAPERLPLEEPVAPDHAPTSGTGVSSGVGLGRARVAATIEEAAEADGDDILVVAEPSSAWTPFLAVAGGLVSETGDEFAPAATIARIYGIPAVVGCRGAMSAIRDGRRITIDGSSGQVRV